MAKIYSLFQCKGKPCQTFRDVKDAGTFISTATSKTFKTNHNLYCHDKCHVYHFICKVSLKQYVGQTVKNLNTYRTITRIMIVIIKSMTHVCSIPFQHSFEKRHYNFLEDFSI